MPVAFGTNRVVQIGNESVRIEVPRARASVDRNRDAQVSVSARDGAVTVQQAMEVMDRLKEGGVEKVGMVTQPRRPPRPPPAEAAGASRPRHMHDAVSQRSTAAAANLRAT